jgi:YbbR domain-containing protein
VTWLRTAGLRLVLAVGLGFALWMFVAYTETPERLTLLRDLPVSTEDLPEGMMIVDQNGIPNATLPSVNVTLRSIGDTNVTPSSNDIQVYLNLSGVRPGENNVPLGARITTAGRKPEVVSIQPEFVSVRVENILTRTVELEVKVEGIVPFSYESQEATASVNNRPITEVQISGPQSRVERVAEVRATVNIDGRTATYNSSRPLQAYSADEQLLEGVLIDPNNVNVSVPIFSSAGIKRVPVVPQVSGEPASGYIVTSLSVDPQFIRITGGASALESVSSVMVSPVDITGATGTFSRTVPLQTSISAPLFSGEPISATVTVEIAPITRPFQVSLPVAVQLVDVPAGMIASVNPTFIQVSLSGTAAQLSAIQGSSLIANISLADYDLGTHTITPSFTAPTGLTLEGNIPAVVVVLRPIVVPTERPDDTPLPSTESTEPPSTEQVTPSAVTPQPTEPVAEPPATPTVSADPTPD